MPGYQKTANGACVKRVPINAGRPPPPTTCPPGYVMLADGRCVARASVNTAACPPGYVMINGQCVARVGVNTGTPPPSTTCPPGYEYNPVTGQCVPYAY